MTHLCRARTLLCHVSRSFISLVHNRADQPPSGAGSKTAGLDERLSSPAFWSVAEKCQVQRFVIHFFHSQSYTLNVLWYGVVRDYEAISYQFTPTFFTSHKRSYTTETRMHYTMCCAFVLYYFLLLIIA